MGINIGFIGLGIMGAPMALNLVRGGYPLRVYDRRAEAMAPLAAARAQVCASPEEAARAADVTFIMVSDTREVEEVILGPNGILAGIRPGTVVVLMSTVSPEAARTLAERLSAQGVEMLDAPASGGESEAADGALTIMAGGKPEVFAQVKPLFEHLGKNIVHVGPSGAGQLAKACNQIVATLALEGVAEAFAFARKNGVDPLRVRDALLGGFAASAILDVQGKRMVEQNYAPGIEARLHHKDLQIILNEAHALGMALPGTALVTQTFNALIGRGGGNRDSFQLWEVIEGMSAPT